MRLPAEREEWSTVNRKNTLDGHRRSFYSLGPHCPFIAGSYSSTLPQAWELGNVGSNEYNSSAAPAVLQ
jgi:hypothetical protein